MTMNILAVESSCDETAVAVVRDGRQILSDCIASQIEMHAIYGGVVPEIASRKHIEAIYALADQALADADLTREQIDAVAVTYAPGLIGAVLVGLNFAKAAALALDVPLIPVHHIRGHIAANYLAYPDLEPPFLCLVVSGGHTLIVDVRDYTDLEILGTTRDDAAGECFDKVARVMGMPYPGGKALDQMAQTGDAARYTLPRAHVADHPLDMSFSGLKSATLNLLHNAQQKGETVDVPSLCAGFTAAVCDTIVPRTMHALELTGRTTLAIAGGVAANSKIRAEFERQTAQRGIRLCMPPLSLCGDNGAMIGAQGYYEYLAGHVAGQSLNAYATMSAAEAPRME
jgi:N6-L-threonylcarbamoyladenine synthase